ncbi:CN37 phosphodiesterase, partial [Atractosteus spatula]|nr:CN37 phosphodiesterase [Atractosteus spatula]
MAEQQQQPQPGSAPEHIEGSLSFPFLDRDETVAALKEARTLFLLRGLPGSGKSTLAGAIEARYQGACKVLCADGYGVQPAVGAEQPGQRQALDEALVSCCKAGTPLVVLDDTHHEGARLERLAELAEELRYCVLLVEPKTPWRADPDQLRLKTHWKELPESAMSALKAGLEAAALPLFFGWFLAHKHELELEKRSKEFLKALVQLDQFKQHVSQFTSEELGSQGEVDLEKHFQSRGVLHCTTKFCDFGKADGAQAYAEKEVVRESMGCVTVLQISAFFATPRTVGARVALTEEQLRLWPQDAEKEVMPDVDLPLGSRAHVTLGCAEGVESVQTGIDLLEFAKLEKEGRGDKVQDLGEGALYSYGNDMWMLRLSRNVEAPAMFSGFYGKKKEGEGGAGAQEKPEEEQGKKAEAGEEEEKKEEKKDGQPEGKKKSKCSVQ